MAQSGSASALGAEGRRFKSCHPDQKIRYFCLHVLYLKPEVLHKNPLEVPPSRHFRAFQVLKFIA